MGISSYAPASAFSTRVITSWWLNIRKLYWPISTRQAAEDFQLGDGGAIDNSGLLPLLQRQAKKVIWIATSYRALSSSYDFQNASWLYESASRIHEAAVFGILTSLNESSMLGLTCLVVSSPSKDVWTDFEATQDSFDPDAAGLIDQLSSAFGYGIDKKDEGFFYSNNQALCLP